MSEQNNRKKKLRIRYRLSVVFFGAVLIFGLMFYKYMKTVTLEEVLSENRTITFFDHNDKKKDDTASDDGNITPDSDGDTMSGEPEEVVNPVPECEPVDKSYLNDCVFIGDSITYGLSLYGAVPSSNVLASVAMSLSKADTEKIDTSFGSVTVIEALTEMSPKNIYVMLGSNGAAYTSPAEMYQTYQAFLNKVRIACPDSRVYIISTPPVTEGKENSPESPIKNANLDELNSKLLEYANNNGVHYLDMNSYLKNDLGYLPSDYADNDGMHFKSSTYTLFVEYILSHVAG